MIRYFLVLISLLTCLTSNAQFDQVSGRFGINGKVKLTKKLVLNTGIQTRAHLFNSRYTSSNVSIEAGYRISKSVKVGISYRNLMQPNNYAILDGKNQTFRNRFQSELSISPLVWLNWDEFLDLEVRTLLQYEHFKFKRNQLVWRNRIKVQPVLEKSRLTPYLSAEVFYRLNQFEYFIGDELETTGLLNEFRYSLGTEVKITKNDALDIGVMLRDFQTLRPAHAVIQLTYIHDFGRPFKN